MTKDQIGRLVLDLRAAASQMADDAEGIDNEWGMLESEKRERAELRRRLRDAADMLEKDGAA